MFFSPPCSRSWHRPQSRFAALLLVLWCGLAGATPGAADTPETRLRDWIRALSAPEFAGRESGTPGGERAARWLEEGFQSLGLKPLFGDSGYRQRFPLVLETRPQPGNALAVGGHPLRFGEDFAAFPYSARGTVEAGLVWVPGDPEEIPAAVLAGRVVLTLEGDPSRNPLRDRARRLFRRGALGLLAVSRVGHGARLSTKAVGYAGARAERPVVCVTRSTAETLVRSSGERWDRLSRGAARELSARVRIQVELRERRGEGWNVGALLPGRDPRLAPVLLGAHYDHLGMGGIFSMVPGRPPGEVDTLHPGADDNASGVAAMLEVARSLRGSSPLRSILFLGFGAEEPGMIGSRYFLGEWLRARPRPQVMINLDMVGRLRKRRLTVEGVDSARGLRELARDALREQGLLPRFEGGGFAPSDQVSFYARRIPVLYFFTGYHSEYHRPSDTWKTLNYPGLSRVARAASTLVASLANREAALEFRGSGARSEGEKP